MKSIFDKKTAPQHNISIILDDVMYKNISDISLKYQKSKGSIIRTIIDTHLHHES
jgi:hypothetical protein